MNFKSLYKAANNELETNKEKALEQIFLKAEGQSPSPKKYRFYRTPAVAAACAAVFILCFGAVNHFSDFTDEKNTTLDSNTVKNIIEADKAEIKGDVSSPSAGGGAGGETEEIAVPENTAAAPPAKNNSDEKQDEKKEFYKEEKVEISETDVLEAEPNKEEVPLKSMPSAEASSNSETAEEDGEDLSLSENPDDMAQSIYAESAESYSAGGGMRDGGSSGVMMNKIASLPLTVNATCLSYSGGELTLNDSVYGKITVHLDETTDIFTVDGKKIKASEIKTGALLTVTYSKPPENGGANITKIVIHD